MQNSFNTVSSSKISSLIQPASNNEKLNETPALQSTLIKYDPIDQASTKQGQTHVQGRHNDSEQNNQIVRLQSNTLSEVTTQQLRSIPRRLRLNLLPQKVKLVEVGARDGLQNEKQILSPAIKVDLINKLSKAGFTNIEAGAFVSPKWVPQMANSTEVMQKITRQPGVIYSALTPNLRGFEAAMAANTHEVVIFGSASESFAKNNINCSIEESLARFKPVADAAKKHGVRLRGSISCAFDCPTEGRTPLQNVINVVRRMRDLGCDEIDIADTTGKATPDQVREVMQHAAQEFPINQLSGHFHDTYGRALDNIQASMEVGIHIFHSSVAGLGGCPYAKGATGNVATEDVLTLMQEQDIETGVDMNKVVDAGQFISNELKRPYSVPVVNTAKGQM